MKKTLLTFLSWRILLIFLGLVGLSYLPIQHDFLGRYFANNSLIPFMWPWANFDGEQYLLIATQGYGQFQYAYFPLYPELISWIIKIFHDPLLIGLLISNLSALGAFVVLRKLFVLDLSDNQVMKPLLLFLSFPATFFIGGVYGEGLFLLLSISSFYFARQKKYRLAGILGGLAAATRLVGVWLFPALVYLWWRQKGKLTDLIPLFLIGVGLLIVCYFNYVNTGDPLKFIHVQPYFGAHRTGGQFILLPQVYYRYLKIFITSPIWSISTFVSVQEVIFTTIALVLAVLPWRKVRYEYLIYSLGVILTPTLTGTFSSMPRYILAAFPIFINANYFLKNRIVFWSLCLLLFILEIIDMNLFLSGVWFS